MFLRPLCFCLCLNISHCAAQDTIGIIKHRGRKLIIVVQTEQAVLYRKVNKEKYFFSTPKNKIRRLTYLNVIHMHGSTYQVRENVRELRRRKIKFYDKYKDGEYYFVKVFDSYIQ